MLSNSALILLKYMSRSDNYPKKEKLIISKHFTRSAMLSSRVDYMD